MPIAQTRALALMKPTYTLRQLPNYTEVSSSRWSSLERELTTQTLKCSHQTPTNLIPHSLSFVGPAMSDAISNLGGGGLSSPYLGNLANALDYAGSCVIALIGGPLVNKFGIKWSCMIAAVTMPLAGSSYYVSAKYGVDWYLLFSKVRFQPNSTRVYF